jgi:hypothetical protein
MIYVKKLRFWDPSKFRWFAFGGPKTHQNEEKPGFFSLSEI